MTAPRRSMAVQVWVVFVDALDGPRGIFLERFDPLNVTLCVGILIIEFNLQNIP